MKGVTHMTINAVIADASLFSMGGDVIAPMVYRVDMRDYNGSELTLEWKGEPPRVGQRVKLTFEVEE